eukprot:scaffold24194_cov50-Skeletonema_dohrnii-CCMP3373.AAC.1
MATLTPNLRTPGNGLRMARMGGISEEQQIPLTRRRVRHDLVNFTLDVVDESFLLGSSCEML